MNRINTTFLLLILAVSAKTQDYNFGLYMRADNKEMQLIEPSVISDKNVNAIFMPLLEKPTMTVYVDKRVVKTSTSINKPEFFFFMINQEDSTPLTAPNIARIIKNYPFVYASSANDFVLVRLFNMKRGRAFRLEKEKILYGMSFNVLDIDKIDYSIIQMDDHSFKLELKNPLPEGEYGFIYNKPTPYDMVIYDFRIE